MAQVHGGGTAAWLAAVLGRFIELHPSGVGVDERVRITRRMLIEIEDRHDAGVGFTPESDDHGMRFSWLTAAQVAQELGLTPQAVTARCRRLGQVPGIHQVPGVGWFVHPDAIPTLEESDEQEHAA